MSIVKSQSYPAASPLAVLLLDSLFIQEASYMYSGTDTTSMCGVEEEERVKISIYVIAVLKKS